MCEHMFMGVWSYLCTYVSLFNSNLFVFIGDTYHPCDMGVFFYTYR